MFLFRQTTHRMIMRYHPLVGHLHVPNIVARIPHENGGYIVRTNSSGFRSSIEFRPESTTRPRILIFGDSFTAGEGCENGERFPELIGELGDAEVYNYGLSGSAPDQHLLLYEEFAQHIEADLIVWAISIHNIERVKLTHRPSVDRITGVPILVPKPYFTLEEGALELHHVPVPRVRPDLKIGTEAKYEEERRTLPVRIYNSPKLAKFRKIVENTLPDTKERFRGLVYRAADVQLYDDYLNPDSVGWLLLAALVERIHQKANGTPVLIVPLPTYHYYVDKLRPAYQPLFQSLQNHRNGVFTYDLTSDLIKGKTLAERKSLCFEKDFHYSPFGHREIARLVEQYIRDHNLLSRPTIDANYLDATPAPQLELGKYVLGVSFEEQDSAAALTRDGEVIAAASEASFTRDANQGGYPCLAVNYCLEEASINQNSLAAIVHGNAPAAAIERDANALVLDSSKSRWLRSLSSWTSNKIDCYQKIRSESQFDGLLLESDESAAHCASAFYPSPFGSAAIISLAGDGASAVTSVAAGADKSITMLKESVCPHNIQTFCAVMANYIACGASDAETQMWALAQFGEPEYSDTILEEIMDLRDDGSIELNREYLTESPNNDVAEGALETLFSLGRMGHGASRQQRQANLSRSVQDVVCSAVVKLARHCQRLTGENNLCISGGPIYQEEVQKSLLADECFEQIWVAPYTGAASAAIGAALLGCHAQFNEQRVVDNAPRSGTQFGSLGPEFSDEEIEAYLDTNDYPYVLLSPEDRPNRVAELLRLEKIIGNFSGRLGHSTHISGGRLILADPRTLDWAPKIDSIVNLSEQWSSFPTNRSKSSSPRVGYDGSLDIHDIMSIFAERTSSENVLIRHLNLPGEAVVCTPLDAYRCFMQSDMDALVLENYLLVKSDQPPWPVSGGAEVGAAMFRRRLTQDKLLGALNRLYDKKCLEISASYCESIGVPAETPFRSMGPVWREYNKAMVSPVVSKVPASLEQARVDPREFAEIMLKCWSSDALRNQFRPILVDITKLRIRLDNDRR